MKIRDYNYRDIDGKFVSVNNADKFLVIHDIE